MQSLRKSEPPLPLSTRSCAAFLLLLGLFCAGHAAAAPKQGDLPSAEEILAQAKGKATAEHKDILLVFSASWCGPCRMFEGFQQDPLIRPILLKYFVPAKIAAGEELHGKDSLNNPGSNAMMKSLAGGQAPGFPFILFLDADGHPIVDSLRPVASGHSENVGYPDTRAEVDWFMTMLERAVPAMPPAENATIHRWLQQHGSN